MLDFIYWPVSFILWCWHWVFGHILGPDNGVAWALSTIFLVFTLRSLLLKPAIHQVKSMRKMQEFQPQIKALQKKYANDKQRQAQEMQKLQKEHGFNPVSGCLPMLFQIPVFIGLNHVLRNFNPNFGSNYFFSKSDIASYLHADIFGAHLNDAMWGLGLLGQSGVKPGWHWIDAPVAIPLMILAAIATHFTARISVKRQQAMGTQSGGQAEMMQKLQLWIFPLGVLTFGAGLLIGLLLYWVSNNAWTLGQQHFVFTKMDRDEAAKRELAEEQRKALAPKPGAKPQAAAGAAKPQVGQKPAQAKTPRQPPPATVAKSATSKNGKASTSAKNGAAKNGTAPNGKSNGNGQQKTPANAATSSADNATKKKRNRK